MNQGTYICQQQRRGGSPANAAARVHTFDESGYIYMSTTEERGVTCKRRSAGAHNGLYHPMLVRVNLGNEAFFEVVVKEP